MGAAWSIIQLTMATHGYMGTSVATRPVGEWYILLLVLKQNKS